MATDCGLDMPHILKLQLYHPNLRQTKYNDDFFLFYI